MGELSDVAFRNPIVILACLLHVERKIFSSPRTSDPASQYMERSELQWKRQLQ